MNNLIIIGIDPGATTAYAILDLQGNLIKLGSSKLINFSSLITEVMKYGTPVIIAADTNPASNFIDKFAKRFGAKLIFPEQNIAVIEKKRLAANFKVSNIHERDALSAALYAFKRSRSLIQKIKNSLMNKNKEALIDEVTKILLTKEGFSISKALESLEKKPEKRLIKETRITFKRRELSDIEKENLLLIDQNRKLKHEIEKLTQLNKYLLRKMDQLKPDEKFREIINFKENRIKTFSNEIKEQQNIIENIKNELNNLKEILSAVKDDLIIKRFKNIGKEMLNKISDERIIFIDNPNIINEEAVNFLKEKIDTIVHKEPINSKIKDRLNFTFIDAKDLIIKETDDFVLIDRKKLDEEKNKRNLLFRIIEDYKEKRK